MELKDLLLYVSGTPGAEVQAALALAQRYAANLTALQVIEITSRSIPLEMDVASHYIAEERKACEQVAQRAREFVQAAAEQVGVHPEWRSSEGETVHQVSNFAHTCDLVVMGTAAGRDERPFDSAMVERTVLVCGKPVLIVPEGYQAQAVGHSVLVAWNGSRESARAITDALPLLRDAQQISLVVVDGNELKRPLGDLAGSDMCRHLSRHGVHAEAQAVESGERSTGEAIVDWAQALDADLIVMGAFGHWRLRELVLGGATRDVLGETRVPVLMSH